MIEISDLQGDSTFIASSLALLAARCRSGRGVLAGVVIVVLSSMSSGGFDQLLLQTAPHGPRVLAVFVARVKSNLVPVDLRNIVVRDGECVVG